MRRTTALVVTWLGVLILLMGVVWALGAPAPVFLIVGGALVAALGAGGIDVDRRP